MKYLSATLPGSRARLASLKLDADSVPATDDRGKSAIAFSFWSRVPSPRPTLRTRSSAYTKQVDTSRVFAPA